MLGIPHSVNNLLTDGGEVVGLSYRSALTLQEDSWYSFLLEAESTSGIVRLKGLGQLKN
jgi:hypothetical protein